MKRSQQRGVVLPVTLIVLVAMTLAGIALLRSVDTSSVIAGNLAFRQSATASADTGIEAAITWLNGWNGNKEQDSAANGYYATRQDALDMTGNKTPAVTTDNVEWTNAAKVKILAADSAGNQVAYVIHRMCNSAGALNAATCSTEQVAQGGSSKGASRQMQTYQPGAWDVVANRGFYRITARVTGPRNTTSFIQVVVSL